MPATVLMVDDDRALLDAATRTLRREPYQLLTAGTGEQALMIMDEESVDVIVCDDQMPGMGGIDVLTHVREHHPDIITLMLSGQASIGTVIRALNQGHIFRFLIKPCAPDELRTSLDQALAHKRLMDACRLLLPLFRRQASLLAAIDQHHPGLLRSLEPSITTVVTARRREDATTAADLSARMNVEIQRSESMQGFAAT